MIKYFATTWANFKRKAKDLDPTTNAYKSKEIAETVLNFNDTRTSLAILASALDVIEADLQRQRITKLEEIQAIDNYFKNQEKWQGKSTRIHVQDHFQERALRTAMA